MQTSPSLLDALISAELAETMAAVRRLRRAASDAAIIAGRAKDPDRSRILRLAHAADELLSGWPGRVLLEARTSAARTRDATMADAQSAENRRLAERGLNVSAGA